jgi:hypothetical protein
MFRLRRIQTLIWNAACALAGRRRPRAEQHHVDEHTYRSDTRRMGVTMTDTLRDRMRPRWFRIYRGD